MNRRDLLSAFGLAAGGAVYDRVNGPSFLFPNPPPPVPWTPPMVYGGSGVTYGGSGMTATRACAIPSVRLDMLRAELAEIEADLFDYCLTDAGGAI